MFEIEIEIDVEVRRPSGSLRVTLSGALRLQRIYNQVSSTSPPKCNFEPGPDCAKMVLCSDF